MNPRPVAQFWVPRWTWIRCRSPDLDVLQLLIPELEIYANVDRSLVWDTRLLHQLYTLATAGHVAAKKGEATLETCSRTYLGADLPKGSLDENGRDIRLAFGQFLNKPPKDIPRQYLEYLAADVIATQGVYSELRSRIVALPDDSQNVWGYVSEAWFERCKERWGPLTHHIQLKASIALKAITRNGLHIDFGQREALIAELEATRTEYETRLREQGVIAKGGGSQKAFQAKFRKLEASFPDLRFPRTETGLFATDADALESLADRIPFVGDLLEYRAVDKLLETFLSKLGRAVVRPSFVVLTRSGRTSSFGELNAQNLPRDDRVRRCFVPSPGKVFLDLDYSAIELAALAQACRSQFSWDSSMANRINAGEDLHRVFAGFVTGKSPGDVTKADRDRVKPINFGKPGGMGNRSLRAYAKSTYGIEYSESDIVELSNRWLELFPEM